MISANFAVAVITVIIRGLLDRIIVATQAPLTTSQIVPPSTGLIIISGTLYYLYNRLVKNKKIQVSYTNFNNRKSKVLDGRIHKNDSQSSSLCNFKDHRWLSSRKFRSHRSRSRCRSNLLAATKDSLDLLHNNQRSSTCSFSSKSGSTIKCRCNKDTSVERTITKEGTPSVYSLKSDGDNLSDQMDSKKDEQDQFKGYGDCDWQDRNIKSGKRRKKIRTTRKTRSGKIYSSYL
ncbi:hypothetical protein TcasGA2_TC007131 [Tribolium castaneum]|uniref:Uncharacterized protein n=1 Tax=Tribolium castaneum TaxID=7070 RepID=A0A139WJY3_TRICA|nr:PREDICTED: uncharacterized protein LOC103312826 [Tribolium castaneum]KYB28127.1 hypothetical protein TcasGA2_TC007131 [Tribolium castaneum]|eukprot:XP_008192684.1 PREDICTED: uncharacterized protein LOC103312826 [Tribolium castaneum]